MQRLRSGLLVLSILAVVAVPAALPAPAFASDVPATTDLKVPKVLVDWVKKNAAALYIVFDEIMDDLTGCPCPPPPADPPPTLPPPY